MPTDRQGPTDKDRSIAVTTPKPHPDTCQPVLHAINLLHHTLTHFARRTATPFNKSGTHTNTCAAQRLWRDTDRQENTGTHARAAPHLDVSQPVLHAVNLLPDTQPRRSNRTHTHACKHKCHPTESSETPTWSGEIKTGKKTQKHTSSLSAVSSTLDTCTPT
jgi:hypothetical protein